MRKIYRGCLGIFVFCLLQGTVANAQFSLSGQFRLRSEFRDGYGSPLPKGTNPGFFFSQRTRLNLNYQTYRLKFGLSIQDVRVWGQDVSTLNKYVTANNDGLLVHEAWAEIQLTDTTLRNKTLSLKIGRQELIYDDQRLIGNLDWAQQARRFDAGVLKYEISGWSIHLAAAYNQNNENNSGTIYNSTPPGNYPANTNGAGIYKSLEFLYVRKKLAAGSLSFLFLTDQFSKYKTDTVGGQASKNYLSSTWARATGGFYFIDRFDKLELTASAYYQFGTNSSGQQVSAGLLGGFAQYEILPDLAAGFGVDYTSGGTHGKTSNSFDPLFGTPHKFWGLMDYFYVTSPFGNGGLTDYYLKVRQKTAERSWLTADFHQFSSATWLSYAQHAGDNGKNFGQELDLTYSYCLTKEIHFEAGYCHFWSTALLDSPTAKNVPNSNSNSNWAYLQVNITPEFFFKK